MHETRGGSPSSARDPRKETAKALSALRDNGYYTQPSPGLWRRTVKPGPNDDDLEDNVDENIAEISVGEGSQCVYAWYLPTYREMASIKNEKTYPMKVGRSRNLAIERIAESIGYTPETFALGFMILTDSPEDWEKLLHSLLNLKNRHIDKAHGTEWYQTNPEELKRIYEVQNALIESPASEGANGKPENVVTLPKKGN